MNGNEVELNRKPLPGPALVPAPYFNLENDLEAVLDENVPQESVAREVLEHIISSGENFGFVQTPEAEPDNRPLREKLLDRWKAKKSGSIVQSSSSSGDAHRWWE